jgi:hypothetical protein
MNTHKLAFWDGSINATDAIRDLTAEEEQLNASFTPIYTEARNRLRLFKILNTNYDAWRLYINSLLTSGSKSREDSEDELNRLLLNYLTFAYSISEHFNVSFRQRYKKDPIKSKEYDAFIDKLCSHSWPFAFIIDYRNYVQHVGLAVGKYVRNESRSKIEVFVTADANQLLKDTRQWAKCALTPEHGIIDLIEALHEFHIHMMGSFASYVCATFFPELQPASEFYGRLTKEVKIKHPTAKMVLYQGEPKRVEKDGKINFSLNLVMCPNDLYGEIGIDIQKKGSRN